MNIIPIIVIVITRPIIIKKNNIMYVVHIWLLNDDSLTKDWFHCKTFVSFV